MRITVYNGAKDLDHIVAGLYAENDISLEQQVELINQQCGIGLWTEFDTRPSTPGKRIDQMTPEELTEFKRRGHEKLNKT
jgi:hypothetical protein